MSNLTRLELAIAVSREHWQTDQRPTWVRKEMSGIMYPWESIVERRRRVPEARDWRIDHQRGGIGDEVSWGT